MSVSKETKELMLFRILEDPKAAEVRYNDLKQFDTDLAKTYCAIFQANRDKIDALKKQQTVSKMENVQI